MTVQLEMFNEDEYYQDLDEVRRFLGITLSKTKYAAKNVRGLTFGIDIHDLMELYKKQRGRCALTGWPLEFTRGGSYENGTNPRAATIDRISNYTGYTRWNIQLTCWMPNKTKGSQHNEDFIKLCKSVVEKNHQ